MPFYCDLIDLAVKADGKIPPELVPYTQALYYDETGQKATGDKLSQDFGKQDYKLLFVAPWDTKSGNRMASMSLKWGGKDAEDGIIRTGGTSGVGGLAGSQLDNEFTRAEIWVRDTKRRIKDAARGGNKNTTNYLQELSKASGVLGSLSNFLSLTIDPETQAKINNAIAAIDNGQKNAGTLFNQAADAIQTFLTGKKNVVKDSNNTIKSEKEVKPSNLQRDTDPVRLKYNSDHFKITLNGASASVGEDSEYNTSSYTIEKSIVCKSSETRSAYNCLIELANYLGVVAPRFSYVGLTGDKWSTLGVSINPPNNFKAGNTEEDSTGGINFINTKGDNKNNSTFNFNLFKYRGEFQLRQGYNIYRNLVPNSITVIASSDMIFLEENPFAFDPATDKGVKGTDETNKAAQASREKFSNMMAKNSSKSASVNVAEEILTAWKAADLCREITLYEGKKGYLFPQWLTLKVVLIPVEPYDGIKATQQLFCYSDNFIKTGG